MCLAARGAAASLPGVTPTTVVPFRAGGKSRLPASIRVELALAMLADVVAAARAVGAVRVVTADREAAEVVRALGAAVVDDPGSGQGMAVAAGLTGLGACRVVNADLPCTTPEALEILSSHAGGVLVAAADGTTNALALSDPTSFAPLYGHGSAARFAAAGLVPVSIPELEQDVDTVADLERLACPVGPRTARVAGRRASALARVP